MDYEKKYNEALERAREYLNPVYPIADATLVQQIFPELRESEDERIRKWLIKTLKGLCNSPVEIDGSYEMMLPAIAWLEKQKESNKDKLRKISTPADENWFEIQKQWAKEDAEQEQKEIPLMNGDADLYFDEWNQQHSNPTKRECFEAGMLYGVRLLTEDSPMLDEFKKGLEQVILWGREGYKVSSDGNIKLQTQDEIDEVLDEQKEQKPAEWSDYKDKVNVPYCSSEPEWSDEDEKMLKRAIHIIVEYSDIDEKESEIVQNWLKSLPLNLKKKNEDVAKLCSNEWGEEDEKMRCNILNALTPTLVYSVGKGKSTGTSTYKYDKEIAWLKSLRPKKKD